jgi:hypothetical protein
MKKALFYTIILAALQVSIGAIMMVIWRLVTGEDPNPANNVTCTIVTMTIISVITAALFLLTKWSVVSPNWIRTRPWAVICWSAVAAVGLLVPSLYVEEMTPELPNTAEETLVGLVSSAWGYLVIGLMAPFVEELVMRGAVLRSLLKWHENHWVGIVISAALFALIHMNPAQMPHAFVVGLLLGWMYYRTGSIIPGVVYHWVNNSVAFAVGHIAIALAPASKGEITLAQMFGSDVRVLMAVGFSLLMFIPALYQLNLRMKK